MAQFVVPAGNRRAEFCACTGRKSTARKSAWSVQSTHGKMMWGRLMDLALEGKAADEQFTFHDLRDH